MFHYDLTLSSGLILFSFILREKSEKKEVQTGRKVRTLLPVLVHDGEVFQENATCVI